MAKPAPKTAAQQDADAADLRADEQERQQAFEDRNIHPSIRKRLEALEARMTAVEEKL